MFSVFPVEEADRVFQQLSQSTINGRAVLRVSSTESDGELLSGDDAMESAASTPAGPHDSTNPDSTDPMFFLPHSST